MDECGTQNGRCEHTCTNTAGSFYCSCNNGFFLVTNRLNCTGNFHCLAMCFVSICTCSVSVRLLHIVYSPINIIMFLDVNECATNNGGCEHNCMNTEGTFLCSCFNGYTLDNNAFNCSGKTSLNYYL